MIPEVVQKREKSVRECHVSLQLPEDFSLCLTQSRILTLVYKVQCGLTLVLQFLWSSICSRCFSNKDLLLAPKYVSYVFLNLVIPSEQALFY